MCACVTAEPTSEHHPRDNDKCKWRAAVTRVSKKQQQTIQQLLTVSTLASFLTPCLGSPLLEICMANPRGVSKQALHFDPLGNTMSHTYVLALEGARSESTCGVMKWGGGSCTDCQEDARTWGSQAKKHERTNSSQNRFAGRPLTSSTTSSNPSKKQEHPNHRTTAAPRGVGTGLGYRL